VKHNRKFSVRPSMRPNSDINVTPLVDVVLVLLIIFMVLTPLLDKMLRVRVPDAEEQEDQPQPPSDNSQIVVSVSGDGEIAINAEKLADDDYVARLKRVVAARASGDRLVFFTADDKAKYARLIVALDGARKAGAEILTMTTEPMAAASPANTESAVPTTPP
jgi:biopolymer transport protein ExbD